MPKVLVSHFLSLSLSLFLSLYCTSLGSVIPWNISQSWFSHSSSPFFPMPSQLCVLHNLSCFHAHVFISLHPLIYSLSNLLIPDSEHTLTLLMLQSPPCFDDAFSCPALCTCQIAFPLLQLFLPHLGVVWAGKLKGLVSVNAEIPFLSLPTWWQNYYAVNHCRKLKKDNFCCKECISTLFQTLVT